MRLEVSKYEGAGNDFLLVDLRAGGLELTPAFVAALCDRRRGIGADGMMALEADDTADCRMRFFNSDGSRAAMCGNGSRCFALFACHVGAAAERMSFRADDGVHEAEVAMHDADTADVMLTLRDVGRVERVGEGWFLDTGVPHLVVPTAGLDREGLMDEGRRLRSTFRPEQGGANVDFASVSDDGTLSIRTYERGVEGETFACGTGAVASAIAMYESSRRRRLSAVESPDNSVRTDSPDSCQVSGVSPKYESENHAAEDLDFTVLTLGGALRVRFSPRPDGGYSHIRLGGPARRICVAEVETENFHR